MRTRAIALAALLAAAWGCGTGKGTDDASSDAHWETPPGPDAVDPDAYNPWLYVPASELGAPRGWRIERGIVHLHSVYSHDACDDEPFVEGVRNEECFVDLREALCTTMQDFAFLTDHASTFADNEFPDVLLYDEASGDTLIERGGIPVANRIACGGGSGRDVVIGAGTETGTMPVGLEHHVGATPEERHAAYDDATPAGVQALKDAGAIALVHHTEEWDPGTLAGLPLDGIEIYNLHANMYDALDVVVIMLLDIGDRPWLAPVPEMGFLPIFRESTDDMYRWSLLLQDRRQSGVLASDIHRNTFSGISSDGERLDSYRRLMHWFSNYVLLPEGTADDLAIKDAIRQGRLYGGFDVYGYPVGFDFHATDGATVWEMGDEVPAGTAPDLIVALPTVYLLAPEAEVQPTVTGRILRAALDGTWEEVASGTADLAWTAVDPGVYRAEILIVPDHVRPWLNWNADEYLADPKVWIYSNPIYVGMVY